MASLLKAAALRRLSEEDVGSILTADKRVYRRMALLGNEWTDWVVAPDGAFVVEEHSRSADSRDKARPVACGRRYPLFWRNLKTLDADFAFRNLGVDARPYLPRDTQEGSVEFRVPDAGKRYVLRLELNAAEAGSLRFRCDSPSAEWEEFPVRPHGEIVVHGVTADSAGMARVVFERASGPDVDVAFTCLMVEEE